MATCSSHRRSEFAERPDSTTAAVNECPALFLDAELYALSSPSGTRCCVRCCCVLASARSRRQTWWSWSSARSGYGRGSSQDKFRVARELSVTVESTLVAACGTPRRAAAGNQPGPLRSSSVSRSLRSILKAVSTTASTHSGSATVNRPLTECVVASSSTSPSFIRATRSTLLSCVSPPCRIAANRIFLFVTIN
jgi:hypothetical protein